MGTNLNHEQTIMNNFLDSYGRKPRTLSRTYTKNGFPSIQETSQEKRQGQMEFDLPVRIRTETGQKAPSKFPFNRLHKPRS